MTTWQNQFFPFHVIMYSVCNLQQRYPPCVNHLDIFTTVATKRIRNWAWWIISSYCITTLDAEQNRTRRIIQYKRLVLYVYLFNLHYMSTWSLQSQFSVNKIMLIWITFMQFIALLTCVVLTININFPHTGSKILRINSRSGRWWLSERWIPKRAWWPVSQSCDIITKKHFRVTARRGFQALMHNCSDGKGSYIESILKNPKM